MNENRKLASEKLRENYKRVEKLLGITTHTLGGATDCEFSLNTLAELLELDIILSAQKFNDSPTVETFYEFGKRADAIGATVKYIGFLESEYRELCSIIITGVKVTNFPESMHLVLDFAQTFHDADEFTANPQLLRAWYD